VRADPIAGYGCQALIISNDHLNRR